MPAPVASSWLEIDLSAIRHNLRLVRQHVGPTVAVLAVVKANAYGHGATEVAKAVLAAGALGCAVGNLAEAIALRHAGVTAPILVMGYTPVEYADEAVVHDISVNVFDASVARAFSRAAIKRQRPARIHVKVDTGMGRLGVLSGQADEAIAEIEALEGVAVEGVFTHFSCADCDEGYTREQIARFTPITRRYGQGRHVHACNSAGALAYPEAHFNLIRLGLAMYGMDPFASRGLDVPDVPLCAQLQPALAWKARIAQVKWLPEGHGVSYGATYRCEGERRIAVVPVGYGDGFRRAPANAGEALVRGRRAPIVGRVCMDQTMLDVTGVPDAQAGDEVVLLGGQGGECIRAEDIAARVGTINYEVTTAITARPPRLYLRGHD
jgi:alanine racemase